jgi:hypothetical protein
MATRGRPPFEHSIAFEEMFSPLKAFYPGIKTRRGLQDKYYALNAYGDLHDMEGFELIDKPSIAICHDSGFYVKGAGASGKTYRARRQKQ